jgi:acyl dehydratase
MTEAVGSKSAAKEGAHSVVQQDVSSESVSAFHHVFGGTNSIHTDPEAARRSQIDGVVQHGVKTLYPLIAVLLNQCPPESNPSVRVDAKFLAAVTGGETVSSSLKVLSSLIENNERVIRFEVAITNQEEKKAVVGTATITTR